MKSCLALVFCLSAMTLHAYVSPGDPVEKLIEEYGEPTGKIDRGDTTVYSYPQGPVRIKDGTIISVSDEFYGFEKKMTMTTSTGGSIDYSKKPLPTGTPHPKEVDALADLWLQDASLVAQLASEQNKPILMLFTGSDWCVGCRLMERDIFDSEVFLKFASESLILHKVDFPRETELPEAVRKQNDLLMDQWMIESFPTIVLLDSSGSKIVESGFSDQPAKDYVQWIREKTHKTQTPTVDPLEAAISEDVKKASQQLEILNAFNKDALKISIQGIMGSILAFYLFKKIMRKR